jgi:ATP:ADP antiporter, AAA family
VACAESFFRKGAVQIDMRKLFHGFFDVEPQERAKLFFLALAFFFIIAGYTIARDLKDAMFLNMVGREYIPYAKTLSMIILVPAIFIYSLLVDRVRRYQLLTIYSAFYGFAYLLMAYYIGHPTIGLLNTVKGPTRIFGWLIYFLVEGYSPFVVGSFWAFANSVNDPESAKKNYGLVVSGSKIGGALSAGLAWWLFSWASTHDSLLMNVHVHQIALFIAALFVLCVPVVLYYCIRLVPGEYLHGYEAAYRIEKRGKAKTGILEGLVLLLKYPYVMGIFGMVYFYEVVSTVLSYLRLGVAEQTCGVNVSAQTAFLFKIYFITHLIGLVIAMFGTRLLQLFLGTRACLLLVPLMTGGFLFFMLTSNDAYAVVYAFIALKALNYAFSWPVRETLYIPTIKDIKFKSKSWIDAFGSKVARTSGSAVNVGMTHIGPQFFMAAHSFFFAGIVALWFMAAFLLGRRFERAVKHNEVIGA